MIYVKYGPEVLRSFFSSQFPLYGIHILQFLETQGIILRDKHLFT